MSLVYPVTEQGAELCSACGCQWDMDLFDEPNDQSRACRDCDCHTWTLVESRVRARHEEQLEQAWRSVGYTSGFEVWQGELR